MSSTSSKLESLLAGSLHKSDAEQIGVWVGWQADRFAQLIHAWVNGTGRPARKAAYSADIILETKPALIEPHWQELIDYMPRTTLGGEQRPLMRAIARTRIPEEYLGSIVDQCFQWVIDAHIDVAVKVHCTEILGQAGERYPELIPEIKLTLEPAIPINTIGFKVRAKRVLRKLEELDHLG